MTTQEHEGVKVSDERQKLIMQMAEYVTHRGNASYSVLGEHAAECALLAIEQAGFEVRALTPPAQEVGGRVKVLDQLEQIEMGARNLNAYLKWQLSSESPGYTPTFPSAVAYFRGQFEPWVFEPGASRFEEHQAKRRSALTSPAAEPEKDGEAVKLAEELRKFNDWLMSIRIPGHELTALMAGNAMLKAAGILTHPAPSSPVPQDVVTQAVLWAIRNPQTGKFLPSETRDDCASSWKSEWESDGFEIVPLFTAALSQGRDTDQEVKG